ncbi:MAG TPA: dihydroneopterin aldolase [Anaerolineae bacterium]|nr:dihydroneopterin aldolase [Anaerolineae bacterium]
MIEDRIHITDLMLRTIIGVNDWERVERQDVLLNITLFGDLHAAGENDQIEDTINYRTVTKQIIQHVEKSQRFTVEALAADVARICLQAEGVTRVWVRIEKPGALRFARSVGVEIERTVGDFA